MTEFKMPDTQVKAEFVRTNFDVIASKYDLFNDLNSFFLHRMWKNAIIWAQYEPYIELNKMFRRGYRHVFIVKITVRIMHRHGDEIIIGEIISILASTNSIEPSCEPP